MLVGYIMKRLNMNKAYYHYSYWFLIVLVFILGAVFRNGAIDNFYFMFLPYIASAYFLYCWVFKRVMHIPYGSLPVSLTVPRICIALVSIVFMSAIIL